MVVIIRIGRWMKMLLEMPAATTTPAAMLMRIKVMIRSRMEVVARAIVC